MLVLTLAVTAGIIMLLSLFLIPYMRFLGSHQEQRTSVESAALVVARDLSRIVVDDPHFGFVGFSDYAPIGKGTTAGDNYYLSVQGINTLLATIRLDLVIADYAEDPLMTKLATQDYQAALLAKDKLLGAINQAVQPGGTATDVDGNLFNPTQDAIDAYQNNLIRMTGGNNSLVPGSLKLTLGYVDDLESNVSICQPANIAQVSLAQTLNGFYKPNVTIPYGGLDFVFCALGKDTVLVDHRAFKTSVSGVPYSIPTVVKCEAAQQYMERDTNGSPVTRTVKMIAAAEAAYMKDKRPAPGAFTISFPNGPIPEISGPADIIKNSQIALAPCDYIKTPPSGDYPPAPLVDLPMNILPLSDKSRPQFQDAFSIAFYDWIRRGGPNVNVKAVIDMLNSKFAASNFGVINEYQFQPDGTIAYNAVPTGAFKLPVSQNQWQGWSGFGFYSNATGRRYDLWLTDYVFQEGRARGGKHAGEPLDGNPAPGSGTPSMTPSPAFSIGPGGGAVRPTYQNTGCAIDLSFKIKS